MNIGGKPVPIIYFYKDGKLVWDYVLPEGWNKGKYGFERKVTND